ncbi:aspartate/glutamate racemase family protein [Oceanobacillus halotolerans]|uniref:aspartate/glutamate racemase family protein n=1 Tax=Oceanobacillus halotolerans TaxID=2663380 RepID=UPI0013D9C148|nr:aspartate/glutamate racemase family protein [Oceanobacillus halotolerans]
MKTIGLIGGMSWESSLEYYRIVNQQVSEKLGGLHSAKCILYSVDFAEIEEYQRNGDWDKSATILANVAGDLEKAGADMIVLATNTMHKVAADIEAAITVPFIHIGDATAKAITEQNIHKVGLLGTKYTMEEDFYHERLQQHQIDVLTPGKEEREELNRIIFEELCVGKILDESREKVKSMIEHLKQEGAEGIVLGCTEVPLLIKQKDSSLPVFSTMDIHVTKAVEEALE